MILHPNYPYRPFNTTTALARILQVTVSEVDDLANRANAEYRRIEIHRPGKKVRIAWDAHSQLKSIHARIQHHFLKKVIFPKYLQGGIRDVEQPRDFVTNALIHTSSSTIINNDIQQFFPSIDEGVIFDIWNRFFNFGSEPSRLLTQLTTRHGQVPQGAKTSSYLANLALWSHEPSLVGDFIARNLKYSRYVDDITVSSTRRLDNEEIARINREIARMCSRLGLKMNRDKLIIVHAGCQMPVTGLITNARVALPVRVRKRIRSLVFNCEGFPGTERSTEVYRAQWNSVAGKVSLLQRLHRSEGVRLQERLRAIKPT